MNELSASKPAVARVFLGALAALAAGLLLAGASVGLGDAGGVYATGASGMSGMHVTPVGFAVTMIAALAAVALAGGALAIVVAWAGALANVRASDRRGWFLLLVLVGVVTFGLGALLVYVLAGPDRRPSPS